MTEVEWLTANDPEPMLSFVSRKRSARRLRLFACACSWWIWPLLVDARSRKAIMTAERFADGDEPVDVLNSACRSAMEAYLEHNCLLMLAAASTALFDPFAQDTACLTMRRLRMGMEYKQNLLLRLLFRIKTTKAVDQRHASFLRDIFGNPFRPISFDPVWRTSTSLVLAKQMYDSRDFSPMPILADALQDAGCENEDILNHCRGDGSHVPGCWVVDLILGKE